jgi:hypothetical protein
VDWIIDREVNMNKNGTDNKEKKTWVKPQLVVYGNVEKLTTEVPGPKQPPKMSGNI